MEFSAEDLTEMLLGYIFGPSVLKYDILSNNSCSKLHAVIDCLFLHLSVVLADKQGWGVIFHCIDPLNSHACNYKQAHNRYCHGSRK